jgi:membrane-associated phospholipid phosphatase
VAAALLPASFALPAIDLSGSFAFATLVLSETGGKLGIPFVAATLFLVFLTREGFDFKRRLREGLGIAFSIALLVGVAALLNEHVVKPGFAVPRPNIQAMAESGKLGLTAEALYGLGGKDERSEYLDKVVTPEAFPEVHPAIRGHWIHETGYSFPSGHSLASTTFATCFFALSLALISGPRRWLFYPLPFWALLVCYSRVLLRVHSPTDVTVGGLEGVLLGTLAFLLALRLKRIMEPTSGASAPAV